jgi:hypothetical protein
VNTLAILTPSYGPDLSGFARLHESVLQFTDASTMHHAIVPQRDVAAFQQISSPRLRIWKEGDFLPKGFVATDRLAALSRRLPLLPRTVNCSAVNLRRPWPPLRGWALQQILKLSAATQLDVDAAVIIDSDVVLVRPMPAVTYFRQDAVRLYELADAVTPDLQRHWLWTRTAYNLLGLAWEDHASFPDYVGGIVSWDPAAVRGCLNRIEEVAGTHWATAVSKHLHFSEFILYGTYVRQLGSDRQRSFTEDKTLCHSYWSPVPMSDVEADAFVARYDESDIAVHIQSNSGTDDLVIDHVLTSLQEDSR